jgi:hypothetical protein
MKRKSEWRAKLDDWALAYLEGYRKISAARGTGGDNESCRMKVKEIVAQHPQLREFGKVEVLPEFLELLLQNQGLADLLAAFQPKAGNKSMSPPTAQFIDIMQTVTLALEDPQIRIGAGAGIALMWVVTSNMYRAISKMRYGDAGPQKSDEMIWILGTGLEFVGKALKSGKPPHLKGKVNVEQVELIRVLREHERAHLTYPELRDALEYAGMHVSDADALRLFEWRAKKRGWLRTPENINDTKDS